LREAVKPMFISSNKQFYQQIAIKVRTYNLAALQSNVEKLWNQHFPQYAYSAQFLDASIAEFYKQDEQLSLLYKIFAGLAIFISCLGLYGLVSFMALQRTKEMGIRKVLGASIGHIVYLFSKEFTVLILLSFVIAVPVAYVMMNTWLQNFVYRVNMAIWMFAVAIVISIVIAWVTVGYKAIRAALANPVESLRAE
jgi:ABC-type antimicrobial peptide transport system permease subunit